jgi:hypothetical protein
MKKDSSIYVEAFSYNHLASKNAQKIQNIQLPSSISAKLAERERNETKSKKVLKIRINNFGY